MLLVNTHNICILGEIRKYLPGHPFNLELWNIDISDQFLSAVTCILGFLYPFQKVQIMRLTGDTVSNLKTYSAT